MYGRKTKGLELELPHWRCISHGLLVKETSLTRTRRIKCRRLWQKFTAWRVSGRLLNGFCDTDIGSTAGGVSAIRHHSHEIECVYREKSSVVSKRSIDAATNKEAKSIVKSWASRDGTKSAQYVDRECFRQEVRVIE
jgi:predicted ATPase